MKSIYFLIPISILILIIAIAAFFWAIQHNQFEDLEKPAHDIIFEDKLDSHE